MSATTDDSARVTEEAAQWLEAIERTLKSNESAALRRWLHVSAHRKTIVDRCRLWHGPEVLAVLQELVPVETFARRVERQYGRIGLAFFLGMSGITFITVLIAASKLWSRTEEAWTFQRADADFRTGADERRTIKLPDGSFVVLGVNTHVLLSYRPQHRELVLLKGEALVSVVMDPQRDFSLHAGVRALSVDSHGARFKVRRSVAVDYIELAVIEGRVTAGESRGPTALTPQLLRARATTGAQVFVAGEAARLGAGWQLAWMESREESDRALEF